MEAYTKQTWDTTSVFNPTRMNHIEEGIYDASTNIKRASFNITSGGQNALYIVTNNEHRIPLGLTITDFGTDDYNRSYLSSINGNVVLNTYKADGSAYRGTIKGYYYYIVDNTITS